MTEAADQISIDICVCTFRRAKLADTLKSLAALKTQPTWRVQVIIADNDDTPSAKPIIMEAEKNFPFKILYVHAPARNISIARNACLNAATARFVAFIDDDECAEPEWLTALIAQQARNNADVVLGPARAIYPSDCPNWLRTGDFHSIKPVWVKDRIITGYTSNALFVREARPLANLRFDEALGRSGGEDSVFFAALHRAGGRIDYAERAVVTELVAPERLNLGWLIKRTFRMGQTHALMILQQQGESFGARTQNIALAFSKVLFCAGGALCALITGNSRSWLLRGMLHAGVVARLLGVTELIQYG